MPEPMVDQLQLKREPKSFIFPEFVDPQQAGLKIIDAGYIVSPNKASGPNTVFINPFIKYLNGILVTDSFTDHRQERSPWIKKQPGEIQALLLSNRIGSTRIGGIYTAITTFLWLAENEGVEVDFSIDETIMAEIQEIVKVYRQNRNITKDYEVEQPALIQYQNEITTEKENQTKKVKVVAEDPSQSYDNLTTQEKVTLANRLTAVSITLLQQNGFAVEKRLFELPPSLTHLE